MIRAACCLAIFCSLSSVLQAAGWGSIEGQIVLEENVPDVPPKVIASCPGVDVPNDSMVFDSETHGVQGVFVYLMRAPEIHPDLKASSEKELTFERKGCRFLPHGLIVRTDQVVVCKNSDAVNCQLHISALANTLSDVQLKANSQAGVKVALPSKESLPVKVTCVETPEINAWWVAVDHPYATITNKTGEFKIENLPAGTHEFRVWHEQAGYIDRAFKVTVKAGETTALSPIKVPLSKFVESEAQ